MANIVQQGLNYCAVLDYTICNILWAKGMVQTGCLFSGKIQTVPRSWKNMLSCSELFKVPRKCLAIQKYNGKVEKSIFL